MTDDLDDVRRIGWDDAEFPQILRHAKPPVKQLWVRGRPLGMMVPAIAIVGARRASAYGLEVADAFAGDLAAQGWCVVSGMAKGVDAAAHKGALRAMGKTIAVLGSGVDVPYPTSNRWLYERIVETGTVITEQPPGAQPRKEHFPSRNRIIAMLTSGLIFVQGRAHGSGAFGTAALANELGKPVFCVPGDVFSALSGGPHALIAEGAICCTSVSIVTETLGGTGRGRIDDGVLDLLPPDQRALYDAVMDGAGRPDELAARASLPIIEVTRALARLEIAGFVTRTDAGLYVRAR